MSDTSLLSSRYQNLADLSERLNQAILTLKIQKALAAPDAAIMYPTLTLTRDNAMQSRTLLSRFVQEITALLHQHEQTSTIEREYVHRLQEKVVTEEDLGAIGESLGTNGNLPEWQLAKLDLLLFLLDDERTTLFRKLRTGRRE